MRSPVSPCVSWWNLSARPRPSHDHPSITLWLVPPLVLPSPSPWFAVRASVAAPGCSSIQACCAAEASAEQSGRASPRTFSVVREVGWHRWGGWRSMADYTNQVLFFAPRPLCRCPRASPHHRWDANTSNHSTTRDSHNNNAIGHRHLDNTRSGMDRTRDIPGRSLPHNSLAPNSDLLRM